MYKLLLCWRYLLTRYLALACIVSVMLGVGTLIVVNSVMSGFSTKLKERLHGLLSDVVVDSTSMDGFANPHGKMKLIREDPFLKDKIVAVTGTMEVFAMLQFRLGNETITRPVKLVGIDPKARAEVGGFSEHLINQKDHPAPSFELSPEAKLRYQWRNPLSQPQPQQEEIQWDPNEPPPPKPPDSKEKVPRGVIVGNLIAHFRDRGPDDLKPKDICLLFPGDQLILTTVSGGKLTPVYDHFVVVDYFKSEMSEYDSNYVFVPLDYLQHLRCMEDRVTTLQIRLKDYERDKKAVVARLKKLFGNSQTMAVATWEDKQGPLLAAIAIERGILNVLLFLIIAVAGFGILAIFSMIVTEKTRDIGILKALGASHRGVMSIFLGYGLLLGLIGAGCGVLIGLALSFHINEVEQFLSQLCGFEVFDRRVYYFENIPVDIQPLAVFLVACGATLIAVLFSVLPALRAALLHPVRALRYE